MPINRPQPAVLVTGARAPAALEWSRQLHHAGYTVYCCDSIVNPICRFSRAITKSYVVPSPRYETDAYIEVISSIIIKHHIEMIVPVCEEIYYLAQYREQLQGAGAELFADSIEKLHKLHHKMTFIERAQQHGFRVPCSYPITNQEDWLHAKKECGRLGKLVLKPAYSRFASKVMLLDNANELPDYKSLQCTSHAPWVLQQYIDGEAICTYSIARDGVIIAHAAYTSRYKIGVGATIHFCMLEHKACLDWIKAFVKAEHFTGQIGFDFIVTDEGTPIPLECNPRATSGIHLFRAEDRLMEQIFSEKSFLAGIQTSHYKRSLGSNIISPMKGYQAAIAPALLLYGFQSTLPWSARGDALKKLCRSRDVLFAWNDPLPAAAQLLALGALYKHKRKYNASWTEVSTIDMEWNGEEA